MTDEMMPAVSILISLGIFIVYVTVLHRVI